MTSTNFNNIILKNSNQRNELIDPYSPKGETAVSSFPLTVFDGEHSPFDIDCSVLGHSDNDSFKLVGESAFQDFTFLTPDREIIANNILDNGSDDEDLHQADTKMESSSDIVDWDNDSSKEYNDDSIVQATTTVDNDRYDTTVADEELFIHLNENSTADMNVQSKSLENQIPEESLARDDDEHNAVRLEALSQDDRDDATLDDSDKDVDEIDAEAIAFVQGNEPFSTNISPHIFEVESVAGATTPDGWEMYYSDEGYPYYYHAETGQSSWDPPLVDDHRQAAFLSSNQYEPAGYSGIKFQNEFSDSVTERHADSSLWYSPLSLKRGGVGRREIIDREIQSSDENTDSEVEVRSPRPHRSNKAIDTDYWRPRQIFDAPVISCDEPNADTGTESDGHTSSAIENEWEMLISEYGDPYYHHIPSGFTQWENPFEHSASLQGVLKPESPSLTTRTERALERMKPVVNDADQRQPQDISSKAPHQTSDPRLSTPRDPVGERFRPKKKGMSTTIVTVAQPSVSQQVQSSPPEIHNRPHMTRKLETNAEEQSYYSTPPHPPSSTPSNPTVPSYLNPPPTPIREVNSESNQQVPRSRQKNGRVDLEPTKTGNVNRGKTKKMTEKHIQVWEKFFSNAMRQKEADADKTSIKTDDLTRIESAWLKADPVIDNTKSGQTDNRKVRRDEKNRQRQMAISPLRSPPWPSDPDDVISLLLSMTHKIPYSLLPNPSLMHNLKPAQRNLLVKAGQGLFAEESLLRGDVPLLILCLFVAVISSESEGLSALPNLLALLPLALANSLPGLNPNTVLVDMHGRSLAHHACRSGNVKILSLLYEAGLDMDGIDFEGRAPLHIACAVCLDSCITTTKGDCSHAQGGNVAATRYVLEAAVIISKILRGLAVNRMSCVGSARCVLLLMQYSGNEGVITATSLARQEAQHLLKLLLRTPSPSHSRVQYNLQLQQYRETLAVLASYSEEDKDDEVGENIQHDWDDEDDGSFYDMETPMKQSSRSKSVPSDAFSSDQLSSSTPVVTSQRQSARGAHTSSQSNQTLYPFPYMSPANNATARVHWDDRRSSPQSPPWSNLTINTKPVNADPAVFNSDASKAFEDTVDDEDFGSPKADGVWGVAGALIDASISLFQPNTYSQQSTQQKANTVSARTPSIASPQHKVELPEFIRGEVMLGLRNRSPQMAKPEPPPDVLIAIAKAKEQKGIYN